MIWDIGKSETHWSYDYEEVMIQIELYGFTIYISIFDIRDK